MPLITASELPADSAVALAEPLSGAGRQADEVDQDLIVAQPLGQPFHVRPQLREHDDLAGGQRGFQRFAQQLAKMRQVLIDEPPVRAQEAVRMNVLVVDAEPIPLAE